MNIDDVTLIGGEAGVIIIYHKLVVFFLFFFVVKWSPHQKLSMHHWLLLKRLRSLNIGLNKRTSDTSTYFTLCECVVYGDK